MPENIGALHRALLMRPAVPLDVFDPYGDPPPFAGRLEMIGMGETRLEDAYRTAVDAHDDRDHRHPRPAGLVGEVVPHPLPLRVSSGMSRAKKASKVSISPPLVGCAGGQYRL